jgi:hypothetical protein
MLKITNQKNGHMGENIHQQATQSNACPVKALAQQIHHILSNGGHTGYTPLLVFQEQQMEHSTI